MFLKEIGISDERVKGITLPADPSVKQQFKRIIFGEVTLWQTFENNCNTQWRTLLC